VRGALNNGCTVEEIREALLHCAVYAGVPAAIEAFRAAQEVIEAYQATSSDGQVAITGHSSDPPARLQHKTDTRGQRRHQGCESMR